MFANWPARQTRPFGHANMIRPAARRSPATGLSNGFRAARVRESFSRLSSNLLGSCRGPSAVVDDLAGLLQPGLAATQFRGLAPDPSSCCPAWHAGLISRAKRFDNGRLHDVDGARG